MYPNMRDMLMTNMKIHASAGTSNIIAGNISAMNTTNPRNGWRSVMTNIIMRSGIISSAG